MLAIGTKTPEFTLPDQNGEMKSLLDFRGQKVILYFYPKDMTSGCTGMKIIISPAKKMRTNTDGIRDPEEMKGFNWSGYRFREDLSDDKNYIFIREKTG